MILTVNNIISCNISTLLVVNEEHVHVLHYKYKVKLQNETAQSHYAYITVLPRHQ